MKVLMEVENTEEVQVKEGRIKTKNQVHWVWKSKRKAKRTGCPESQWYSSISYRNEYYHLRRIWKDVRWW